jgi:hypothetical protein
VVVWSAPEAVQDKIAKMRSLGSLKAWGALTKVASAPVFASVCLCLSVPTNLRCTRSHARTRVITPACVLARKWAHPS